MRAYYFDNVPGDQRLAHDSGLPVDDKVLASIGVLHWHVPVPVPTTGEYPRVDAIARERSYKNRDVINITKEGLGDLYETKLKTFYEEHMHEDEEIRYILDGSGFFDVREHPTDKWIRCAVDTGDLVVLPAGIYHRFTLDEKNVIKAMRLFKARITITGLSHSPIIHKYTQDEPKWIPYNRGDATDINPYRIGYLQSLAVN